ncbi:MAG TPA: AI-2E family transporter [Trebonia sp.]|nr:AI-2E family transporter [Trebonia sp.]
MNDDSQRPLGARVAGLWRAADRSGVPLRTIIVAVLVVAFFYLSGKLIYRLRDVVLLILVAGFIAVILNPLVLVLQRYVVKRRGYAVTIVTFLAVAAFAGLAFAFGYPLVNGITHFADNLPSYVASVEHGKGWLGHLATKYHVQQWVSKNAPKLVSYAQGLSKPALSIGEGALTIVIELFTIFVIVLLLLLEGPKMRRGFLGMLAPGTSAEVRQVSSEVNKAVVGYMLGNFLTSVIAGIVVFVALLSVGVPFPQLWALWVALVDFLPLIGGALAGIPVVLFAAVHSLTAGIVTLVVFLCYTQIENHVLNPIVMSKTVRISPLLVLMSVLVGASIGAWIGGIFGGFVAALLSIPAAGALQVIVREGWRLTGPPLRVAPTDPQQAPLPDQPEPPVTDEQEAPVTDEQEESASHQLPADGVNVPGRDPVGQRIAAERNSLHHPK